MNDRGSPICFTLCALLLATFAPRAWAADSSLEDVAEPLHRAAAALVVDSPSNSVENFKGDILVSQPWLECEKQAWEKNATARELIKPVVAIPHPKWPEANAEMAALGDIRPLSEELADAAVYQHIIANDAAALETLKLIYQVADVIIRGEPSPTPQRMLVAAGTDSLASQRLVMLAPRLRLVRDGGLEGLAAADVRGVIKLLLDQRDAQDDAEHIVGQVVTAGPVRDKMLAHVLETTNARNAERTMAAVSLACQLYRFDNGRWPKALADLVPAYLPSIPLDPFGDGRQSIGYFVIPHALPDGGDRPMVYDRGRMEGKLLYYPADLPEYGTYWFRPGRHHVTSGQFRDIAAWSPKQGVSMWGEVTELLTQ